MKTFYKISMPVIALLIIGLMFACGKDTNGGTTDIYIPDINGTWVNAQDANNQFSFFDAPNNAASGTFNGNEGQDGSGIGTITGSFNHSKINFTVTYNDNSKPAATYSGTVSGTANQKMVITSAGKTITLNKQQF
jgi:hypothetical protein